MEFNPSTTQDFIAAIETANQNGGVHTIHLRAGTNYRLTTVHNSDDWGSNGLPIITANITFQGNGATVERDPSAPEFRIFHIDAGSAVTIKNLTIRGGSISSFDHDSGGGIYNKGTLAVEQCQITDNSGGSGGGIYNVGNATITDSLMTGNIGLYSGGGIVNEEGTLNITRSSLVKNHAGSGGAIHIYGGSITVTESNFSANETGADGIGGAIYTQWASSVSNSLTAIHCTFANNKARMGGCIFNWDYSESSEVIINNCRIFDNQSQGFEDVRFAPREDTPTPLDARYNWWGASNGPSGSAAGSGDSVGPYIDFSGYLTSYTPPHTGGNVCSVNYEASDVQKSGNPISLRLGEKRFEATDLTVATPAGQLAFTRTYSQSRMTNANYQFMGLGWSHAHALRLVISGTAPTRVAEVFLPEGTVAFNEQSGTPGIFKAGAGSSSQLVFDAVNDQYILTGQDKGKYFFNGMTLQLGSRLWPSGESWTLNYTNGKLVAVNDAYGRQLKFAYINAPGQYHNGQLWRVGDHGTTGLDNPTPTGRYVELGYTPEKCDGVTISNPKALLASVRDVLGNIWTYDYFGQNAGESDTDQLNLLTKRVSPITTIVLENLEYVTSGNTITGIAQKRGIQGSEPALLDTAFAFQAQGQNVTTETERVSGKVTTHKFGNGIYTGTQDPAGNYTSRVLDNQFRPATQMDANGNNTLILWDPTGKHLLQVTDALGSQTVFSYNLDGVSVDALKDSTDAEGRKTEYTYGDTNNPRLPTRVEVLDGATILRRQGFTYDSYGRALTEQALDPSDDTIVQQQVTRTYYTSGNGNGLLHTVTQTDIGGTNDTSTTYTYDSAGRVIKTQQNSNFGGCTISYTVYDVAGNVVATICNYDPGSGADPTTADEAVTLFHEVYPDKNQVTTHEYDALGRRFKSTTHAGATYAQTTLTVYDALNRVVRTIANYVADATITDPFIHDRAGFNHGADNTQNLVTDTAYNERGAVRKSVDVLGNVILYGYGDAGRLVKTVQSASQPNYDNFYETGDPTLANYTPGTDPDKDIITSQEYDPAGNLIKAVDVLGHATFTVYDALNRPVKTVRSAKDGATVSLNPGDTGYVAANDPRSDSYVPSAAPDRDLIDLTEYDSMGRVRRTQDSLGNWTLYGYDALGRQVKVIRNAATPAYNMTSDPALASYAPNSAADQDILTQTAYDSSGRVMYSVDVQGERTWSKYDGLGRQIKTIANAVGTATDGSANDPRSDSYVPSTAPDRDLVSLTHYDSDGRVQWTLDPVERKTWYVYDSLGRQVKTIRNCSYTSGTPAPEDETYVGSTDPDKDLIARTEYDAQGRVWKTSDDRGNETHYTYDVLGRQIQVITNYVNSIYDSAYPDEDLVTTTSYDLAGRVVSTIDAAGNETRYVYDAVGRRTQTIGNYVDGVYSTSAPDEDLIMTTTFNRAGQVIATTDVRGTQTTFTYDAAGRTLQVTQAAGTPLATASYTCYDKGGRTLRTIQNYRPQTGDPAPDARDTGGNWLFNPAAHGLANDENLITIYTLDKTGRQVAVSDALGNTTQTTYFKAGGVESVTDPENAVSQYRYDRLHRRLTVVQGYQANGQNPANWVWDATDGRWEQSSGTAITFGDNNDRNVIAQVEYDKVGRMVALRDPRGNRTTYTYDLLDRRTSLTNPLSQTWATAFSELTGGKSRLTLTDPLNQQTQQDFDRLGRLQSLAYLNETPKLTPDVTFAYNAAGVRTHMDETVDGSTTFVRKTAFSYDKARRLTGVDFDTNGDGSVEQTVTYQYDAGGLRTRLTLPGSQAIVYTYNAKGQLVSLTDWANQTTRFAYDQIGRRVAAEHHNGLLHQYRYDPAGRLKRLRHSKNNRLLGQFEYQVDKRGNRTQVYEALPRATTGATTFAYDDSALDAYRGTWTDSASFKASANFGAELRLAFCGMGEATLRMGVGPDHSTYDVYVDGALWQSFNGYAASAGDVALTLPLTDEGPHLLDLRNRPEKDKRSTGYVIRFHSLTTPTAARQLDLHTTQYTYDALARLIAADSYPGLNTGATATRHYAYAYDLAGNRTQANDNGTITNATYNAANQITSGGVTYDAAGRLTSDGTNTYAWDRANRLLSMGGATYQYNGNGQRVQQTVGSLITAYLNDLQPGLWQVLQATTDTDTTRYVHGPNGLQQQQNPDNAWLYPVQDGLGSVRGVVAADMNVLESLHYAPYGDPWGLTGTSQTDFGFTGEPTDANGLVYLRARYYNPALGQFFSSDEIQSNNLYQYASSNPVNRVDPSGLLDWLGCKDEGNGIYSCKVEEGDTLTSIAEEGGAHIRYGALVIDDQQLFGVEVVRLNQGNPALKSQRNFGAKHVDRFYSLVVGLQLKVPNEVYDVNHNIVMSNIIEIGQRNQVKRQASPLRGTQMLVDGYIEGLGNNLANGVLNAEEMVYNFATFERIHFKINGGGIGVSLSAYVGSVFQFGRFNPNLDNFEQFISDYGGETKFTNVGIGGNWGPVGAATGISSYRSVEGSTWGNNAYLSLGAIDPMLAFVPNVTPDFSSGITTARNLTDDRKSYLDRDRCQVRDSELYRDVMWGYGSPIGLGGGILAFPFRFLAAAAASHAAGIFNQTHNADSCKRC